MRQSARTRVCMKGEIMCLAIPAKVTEKADDGLATVDILGVKRGISLDLTPQAEVGDYVLVHAGFAIEVIDEATAQETIDLIREFPDLIDEDMSVVSSGTDEPVRSPMTALAAELADAGETAVR